MRPIIIAASVHTVQTKVSIGQGEVMIEIMNLTRKFGNITAVDGLEFDLKDGEVFGFIGPNGAGKTTTVRMLTTLISPSIGTAYINGLDITRPDDALKIRGMIGLLPEVPGLYDSLSAYRNLRFFAKMNGVPEGEMDKRISDLLKTLGVWDRRDDAVGKFSKGMKQKIAIARALVHDPEFLFLDEPTSGLDPEAAMTVRNYLLDLKKEGRTIFINTHNLDDAERLCDKIGVMKCKMLAYGSPEDLSRMFWGHTTIVHLRATSPDMVEALKRVEGVSNIRQMGNRVLMDVVDPSETNPEIISALVSIGAKIEYVNELKRGLEDVYIKLIGGSK